MRSTESDKTCTQLTIFTSGRHSERGRRDQGHDGEGGQLHDHRRIQLVRQRRSHGQEGELLPGVDMLWPDVIVKSATMLGGHLITSCLILPKL